MSVRITDYPAAEGRPVTDAHARMCAERGHATWTRDGRDSGTCPRCGEVDEDALADNPVIDYEDDDQADAEDDERPFCEWYALCDREAIGTTKHPIIGDVPICQRCADKHSLTVDRF